MISPNTAPGAFVECIQEHRTVDDIRPHIAESCWRHLLSGVDYNQGLRLHGVYELESIQANAVVAVGYDVRLRGYKSHYVPGRFRMLELPRCLTSLLTDVPMEVV